MTERRRFRLIDTTLKDGSNPMRHQFTAEQVSNIAKALDEAGVPVIEVGHGDGLGGSSFNYGFSRLSDRDFISAAAAVVKNAALAVGLSVGIGVADQLREARDLGASMVRIVTHCTEADMAVEHIGIAKSLGMEAIGFLTMTHMATPAKLLEQAKIMEAAGADGIYLGDSAGAMVPDDITARFSVLKAGLDSQTQVGLHAHNNLGLAVANTIAALEAGAENADGCTRGLGAGAGNTPTELLVAVTNQLGWDSGVDFRAILDVAEDVVRPVMPREQVVDRTAIILGYAGVHSTFLVHAQRAADRFGVDVQDILLELGRRKIVGGQEDMILDVVNDLLMERSNSSALSFR